MIQQISQFDTLITNQLFSLIPHSSFFDLFFQTFSYIGGSMIVWVVLMFFLIIFEEIKKHVFILYFSLGNGLTWILTEIILKNIFMRQRPMITDICPTDFSLPSTHASTAFASAVILSSFDKKRRYLYYLVASLISYSRIYLGCHYFLDIVVGGLVGAVIAQIVLHIDISYRKKK
ncbi:hypothetical protein A2334_00465 [Candidatus Roizmanbacteria bacterium RIFOXYB2_FULL_38_10]|uniref:Phosphatidic acid phosphatase type 2/haloperoxidase domain-containing protein n=1 Tax=Candidatus Roizmanbacteria bacterium RIFOXYD1_FULL_38_12 TaxID=1802093 RepID=A0A1F7L164_9BACT|nr:MAG: hypothetical protein A3K47_03735 [Candidatus Roizmanbacteria bacterium RIFOXYA2_FULL_38_14]OGK63870.1 MAG: hypothetical protein A3K27_03735 [Candidatus Roizmanbacteria bacterium RIFOXYA1_FULL_37_12]OGK65716.1 MAG: hypothetical protein A3K38_03735 [Candidatus Roizmanbacteria bacterium RIFOXYB1_FULL_40_23]OGK68161.1 MAG: hypothetical protein A2334_00465 [Candidatus Roizmanbacteria bacterium RIFOXYB2_FULL_38_10]OGK70121.1 MAG: hypothetical protein A3K21_03740 [Candidatus Roizmanbacteria ba